MRHIYSAIQVVLLSVVAVGQQPMNIQPGSGTSAQVSGEYYLGNNTLSSAIGALPAGGDLVVDSNATVTGTLNITTSNIHIHCLPGITISWTGNFSVNWNNVTNDEWDHCTFVGQGVNTGITTSPHCIGCSGNLATSVSFHDNILVGFGSGAGGGVVEIGQCNHCRFYNLNTLSPNPTLAPLAISNSTVSVTIPTTGNLLSSVTYSMSSTTGLAVGNSVKVYGYTAADGPLNNDDCVITALTTNVSITCENEKVTPSNSPYAAQSTAHVIPIGNGSTDFFWNVTTAGAVITDGQIYNNNIGEFSAHANFSSAPCPQFKNMVWSNNVLHGGMNGKQVYPMEIGDFSSASCQNPDNFIGLQSNNNQIHLDSDGSGGTFVNGGYSFSTLSHFVETGDSFDSHCHPYRIYAYEHVAVLNGTISGVRADGCGGGGLLDLNRGSWITITGGAFFYPCIINADCNANAPKNGISIGAGTAGIVFTSTHNVVSGNYITARVDLCPTTPASSGNCTVAGAVGNGTTVTFTTQTRHPFRVGDTVYVFGLTGTLATVCNSGCAVLGTSTANAPTTAVPYQFTVTNATSGTDGNGGYAGDYNPTSGQVGLIGLSASGSGAFVQYNKIQGNRLEGGVSNGGASPTGMGLVCGFSSSGVNSNNDILDNDVDTIATAYENNGCTSTWYRPGQISNVNLSQATINSGTYAKGELVGTCTLSAGTCTSTFPNTFTFTAAPSCQVTWNGTGNLTGFVKAVPSTTTVAITSSVNTDTGVMNWNCKAVPSVSASGTPF